jgi:hypothetical protein
MGSPAFATIPRVACVNISTANTNKTDTGTITGVFTAGANGSKIERVAIKATGTTTAGMVRLWTRIGSVNFLLKEIDVTAITPSGTVKSFESEIDFSLPDQTLLLAAGNELRASTHNAESFNVFAFGGDFPA